MDKPGEVQHTALSDGHGESANGSIPSAAEEKGSVITQYKPKIQPSTFYLNFTK